MEADEYYFAKERKKIIKSPVLTKTSSPLKFQKSLAFKGAMNKENLN
jgi:hypothetical protein